MHTFGKEYPDVGFTKPAWEVMALAGNLPLGLKVLGSALRGMSKQEWKRTLPRLKTRLDGEIESIIKFSYNVLCDEDKDLFLYIACLCNYRSAYEVEEVLANKFWNVRHGLHVLAEKSLISIESERVMMHTLLEQFGRETSRKQFVHHGLTKRQLLVDERDIREVLSDDTTDNRRFVCIEIDLSESRKEWNISKKALEKMSGLEFIGIYEDDEYDYPKRLHSLLYHSQKIRSLHWSCFKNICLPSTFNPEFLVELVMNHSKLQKLWEGTKQLKNLKWVNFSYSTDLKELPDLSTATNLQKLVICGCSSLIKLPESIGDITTLKEFDLTQCSSLVKLPSSIGFLTNLEILKLIYCSSLLELPHSIGTATNLKEFEIRGCSSLVKLPDSVGYITTLTEFDLSHCSSLVKLPDSIGDITTLKEFDLSKCSSLVKLPSSIGYLTNLEILKLNNYSSLAELPSSIGKLTNLEELDISGCSSLVKHPSFIGYLTNLEILKLDNCTSKCSSLLELPPCIGTATNLQEFDISGYSSLVKLPDSFGDITTLGRFYLSNCSSLIELPSSIGKHTNLRRLDLSNCSSLVELPSSIGNLQQLWWLRMCGCSKLEALPTNINLESLHTLDLTDCSQLKSFPEISTNISDLYLIGTAIKEVPLSIMSWSRLSYFRISYFEGLKEFLHSHDIITELHFLDEDMKEVPPWVKGLSYLRVLRLYNCNNLVSLPQLSDSLSEIVAENCQSLERLDCSFNNRKICLNFTKCFSLNQEARDLIMHSLTPYQNG